MDPMIMGRRRLEEEVWEVMRGLLLRMWVLLDGGRDLDAAGVAYSVFSRLGSGERGRPRRVAVTWGFIGHVVDNLL